MAETPKKRRDIGPSYRSAPHAHTSGLARREERKREAKEEESEREREYRRGSVYVFFLFFNRCLVWRRQSSREGLFFGLSSLEHFRCTTSFRVATTNSIECQSVSDISWIDSFFINSTAERRRKWPRD